MRTEPETQDSKTDAEEKDSQVPILARSVVHIQRPACEARVKAQVLGAVPGAYIVFRDSPGRSGTESRLSSVLPMIGDTLLVRFLHEGIVFGFRSTVSRVVSEPEFLLFVQYPKRVERFSVRDQRRWACGIPCIFDLGSQSGQAIMMNVNAKGCGVAALMHAGSDPPATDDILTIKLRTPESDRLHSLKGIVRRIECNERTWQAGILFEEDQEQMMEQVKPYLAIEAER